MSTVTTLGQITSEPNDNNEHLLKCPKCKSDFLSSINKDDKTNALGSVLCPTCKHFGEPKFFVAAVHQDEVNSMAMNYATTELSKLFKKFK